MPDKPFVHLHCHTDYSLLDGACETSRLMKHVQKLGQPAVALTDHGNLFGAVEFYNKAQESGVHPVLGCEVYISQKSRHEKNDSNPYNHLVLLCENQDGYRNLIDLVSTGFLDGFYYKPRIDKDLLARHSKGLIAMSACLKGDVNEKLMGDRYDEARRLSYEYQDMFGKGNFFLEIQDHGLEEDRKVIPYLSRLSAESGIPLVATNDAHYVAHSDARAQDILVCIQTGKTVHDEKRMKFTTDQFFIKSRDEMMKLFGEMESALDITNVIAQRCQVKLEKIKNPFPKFDVPESHTLDTYFEYIARQGFEKRRLRLDALKAQNRLRHDIEEYSARLDFEIKLIKQMKFAGYFLIVWDFIRYAKQHGIPVGPGRGSAAGSLVAYCMDITDVDPLHYGLLFERFLNPERVSMPDIDIDFCTNRRAEVIQYVTERYGREQVAQIITFGTLGAKAALKDVGRALGLEFGEVERVTKLVPTQPLNIKLKQAMEDEPQINDLAEKDPRIKDMLEVALNLEGMARNCSVHAAGVVISPQPLRELVPLYRPNKEGKDEVVTQYDMGYLEKLGLLKMDFLGLTTLTIIHNCLDLIEKTTGQRPHADEIPLNDAETFSIFSRGLTNGIFQFESGGMKDILMRYQPDRLEDLIALNALYRPGPMSMIDDFIDRKHGRKEVVYDLQEMKPILEETYGVMVYQEQVMQIANVLAGYSLGEADLLRRAMGKKDIVEMANQRARFMEGAAKKNFPKRTVERVFDHMEKFAGYGFNKSHSAAYAYLAYITAYLKAHHAVEFMSALLTSETGNTDKVVKYINECRDLNIKVLPPDVNASHLNFTPDEGSIRFGLGAIKNVGVGAVEAIVNARNESGPFKDLYDFTERVEPQAINRRVVESMIKAGAMDRLTGTRSQKWAVLDDALDSGSRAWRDKASGQVGLFGELLAQMPAGESAHSLPDVKDWTNKEKLTGEKEMTGFYVTGHPLDEYDWKVKETRSHASDGLEGLEKGAEVRICGILTGVARRKKKDGTPWASAQLEDWSGTVEVLLFTTKYKEIGDDLQDGRAVLIKGKALPEDSGLVKVSIQEIVPLDVLRVDLPSIVGIRIRLTGNGEPAAGEQLTELFAKRPGTTSVRLKLEKRGDFLVTLDVPAKVRPDKDFQAEVARICGPDAYEVLAS